MALEILVQKDLLRTAALLPRLWASCLGAEVGDVGCLCRVARWAHNNYQTLWSYEKEGRAPFAEENERLCPALVGFWTLDDPVVLQLHQPKDPGQQQGWK